MHTGGLAKLSIMDSPERIEKSPNRFNITAKYLNVHLNLISILISEYFYTFDYY
jgi:hypothetical protein